MKLQISKTSEAGDISFLQVNKYLHSPKIIKGSGEMVVVEKPQSGEYSSMQESAIKMGSGDYQLLPEEMPGTILKHINKWIKNNDEE